MKEGVIASESQAPYQPYAQYPAQGPQPAYPVQYAPQGAYPQQQGVYAQPYIATPATTIITAVQYGCPSCGCPNVVEDFSCLGVCLAIVFFPIGILCCLVMRDQRCANCGTFIRSSV
jgi:hypothetical protein